MRYYSYADSYVKEIIRWFKTNLGMNINKRNAVEYAIKISPMKSNIRGKFRPGPRVTWNKSIVSLSRELEGKVQKIAVGLDCPDVAMILSSIIILAVKKLPVRRINLKDIGEALPALTTAELAGQNNRLDCQDDVSISERSDNSYK